MSAPYIQVLHYTGAVLLWFFLDVEGHSDRVAEPVFSPETLILPLKTLFRGFRKYVSEKVLPQSKENTKLILKVL